MTLISNSINRGRVPAVLLGCVATLALAPGSALASHRHSRHHHAMHSRGREIPGRGGAGCIVDGGGYCVGQCVDFVWTKRPELSHLGNATDWLAGAQKRGIPTGHTPVVGAVAWWSGVHRTYADSAYGHVAYVTAVGNGTVTFQEMNALAGPGGVDTNTMTLSNRDAPQAYIYGGPAGNGTAPVPTPAPQQPAPNPTPAPPTTTSPPAGATPAPVTTSPPSTPTTPTPPAPTPPPPPPPAPTYYAHHVTGTCRDGSCGLILRSGPGYSSYADLGVLPEGAEVDVACQAMGQTVSNGHASSGVWDRLSNGDWVSDFYLDTPNVGTFSPPIPQCS